MEGTKDADTGRPTKIGIITFHCSDNIGALLQAYGLLTFLMREGYDVRIVNYAPCFLRGREWFIPYLPHKSFRRVLSDSLWLLKRNLAAGHEFYLRKKEMEFFRSTYLTGQQHAIRSLRALAKTDADILITGSDQIWNPDITFGFRPAYFGAFSLEKKQKIIAYAASFGSTSLREEDEVEFAQLLSSVDVISMREQSAADYIRNRFGRTAVHTVDPVFLLSAADWHSIEQLPEAEKYVFYYETQRCDSLREAACNTAARKNLQVIGLSLEGNEWGGLPIRSASACGPAQFLGYVSAADYVFTNSFHGLALSIIMQKQFSVHRHKTVGSRLENLLYMANLQDRLADGTSGTDIDHPIDWQAVRQRLKPHQDRSVEFLCSHLPARGTCLKRQRPPGLSQEQFPNPPD